MQNDCGWSWNQINNFVSIYGIAVILSGMTVKPMLNALGLRNFTSFANLCNTLSLLFYARVPPVNAFLPVSLAMYFGVVFGAPGSNKKGGLESMVMKIGNDADFGNGFVSGCLTNLRSVINIFSPLLFGSVYAWGAKRKYPAFVFLVGAATVVVSEAVLRSLSNRDLGLDKAGKLKQASMAKSAH